MPRLSATGRAVQGAGGVVSVDGGPQLAVGWLAQWLDDDRIIYSGDRVETLNVVTGEVTELHWRGVNNLSGNGGKWIGWHKDDRLIGDVPPASPDFDPRAAGTSPPYADGRGAIGRDGTIAYVPNRQLGSPTVLRAPDGSETAIDGAPYGLQVLGPASAVWTGGSLNAPVPPAGAISPKVCGDWMVYYKDGQGLVGRRIGTSLGVIFTTGSAFNHDAIEGGGDVLAAWSTTQGEMPVDLRTLRVSQCPLVDLDAGGQIEPIVDVNRALWIFGFGDGTLPVNCRMRKIPGVIGTGIEALDGTPICHYVNGEPSDVNPEDIERAVDTARSQLPAGRPILAYVPHGVRLPANADWIGPECYMRKSETLEGFEESRRQKAIEAGRPIVWICQTYSSNANQVGHTPVTVFPDGTVIIEPAADPLALRRLVPVYARLLRGTPPLVIKGGGMFSVGPWRRTGYEDHPEIHPDYQQLTSTIQTPPTDTPDPGDPGGPIDPGDPPVPTGPTIEILSHPRRYVRGSGRGMPVEWDVSSESRIVRREFRMHDDGGDAFAVNYDGPRDGRYYAGGFFKLDRSGRFHPQVTVIDDQGRSARSTSPLDVEVTEPGGPVDPPPDPGPVPPAGAGCVNDVLGDPEAFIFAHLSHLAGHPIVKGNPSGGPSVWQPLLLSSGFTHNPPEGSPLPMDAPYFGIAMGVSGGQPTSRVWLPTEVPYDVGDGNKWYLHRVDLIHHETQTWQYHDWTGDPPYVPRPCST